MKRYFLFLLLFILTSCSRTRIAGGIHGDSSNKSSVQVERLVSDTISIGSKKEPELLNEVTMPHSDVPSLNNGISPDDHEESISRTNQAESLAFENKKSLDRNSAKTVAPTMKAKSDLAELDGSQQTFERLLNQYVSGKHDVTRINDLLRASEFQPQHSEVIRQLTAYYLITNDVQNATIYLQQWRKLSEENDALVGYGNDLLNSLEKNGVLVLNGVSDTYAVISQQLLMNKRLDVTIVSMELMHSSAYRERLKNSGFQLPDELTPDRNVVEQFCQMNSNRNIFLSMTLPADYFSKITSKLYTNGITFYYSESSGYDNFYRNEYLWNSQFDKVVLNGENQKNNSPLIRSLSSNYLPMLLQLRKVYRQREETDRVIQVENEIQSIAKRCGKTEIVNTLLLDQE